MEDEDVLAAGDLVRAEQAANLGAVGGDPDRVPEPAGGEADDGTEEIEHDGQFYKIPRALKGAFLMNADYTRKTQELAEHRRAVERARSQIARNVQAIQAEAQDQARLAALDEELGQFEAVDWDALAAEDPHTAQALWARYQQFHQAREHYAFSLSHRVERARLEADRDMAEQMTRAGQVLAREIEGWSPEVAMKLVEYADAFGVTLDELREAADPRLWKLLHRAHQGEELTKQQAAAKAAAQAQSVRPAVQVSGAAATGGGVRDELATREWMRRRNEQSLRGR